MPVDVPAGPPTFQLPEALELTAAAPLTEALLRRVGQVLIAAARAWKAEGDSLTLDRPSPRFLEDLSLLGYEPKSLLNGAASS
jgi:hypothetical protein